MHIDICIHCFVNCCIQAASKPLCCLSCLIGGSILVYMGLFIRSWHCKDTIVYKLQYTYFSRLIRIAMRLVKRSMRGQIQLKRKGQAEMVHARPRTCFENARIRIYYVLGPMIFRHQTRSKHDIYMWVSILAMECVRKLPRGQVLVLQSQRRNLKCVHLMWEKMGYWIYSSWWQLKDFFMFTPIFWGKMKPSQFDNCAYFSKVCFISTTNYIQVVFFYPFSSPPYFFKVA